MSSSTGRLEVIATLLSATNGPRLPTPARLHLRPRTGKSAGIEIDAHGERLPRDGSGGQQAESPSAIAATQDPHADG
jgi:hypothetical protein